MNSVAQRNEIVNQVIDVIVDAVNLRHVDKATVTGDTPLTHGGLGLDSIDILEIVVAVEHKFGKKVADAEVGKKYFQTIGTIADFVLLPGKSE
ncbi:MAG TPA: phosphopantetheine-binding protein [Bdellovibrionales bacterium]|nr:phosphopantetheine-binding protein [Bdellovibrionales bacterium]